MAAVERRKYDVSQAQQKLSLPTMCQEFYLFKSFQKSVIYFFSLGHGRIKLLFYGQLLSVAHHGGRHLWSSLRPSFLSQQQQQQKLPELIENC